MTHKPLKPSTAAPTDAAPTDAAPTDAAPADAAPADAELADAELAPRDPLCEAPTAQDPPPPVRPSEKPDKPPHAGRAPKTPPHQVALTEKLVLELECDPGKPSTIHWDKKLIGFGLRVSRGGARAYLVSHRINGISPNAVMRDVGRAHPVALPLKNARDAAAVMLHKMRQGIDPRVETQKSEESQKALRFTLSDALEARALTLRPDGRPRKKKTLKNERYYVNHYLSTIKDKPLALLTTQTCKAIYDELSKPIVDPLKAAAMADPHCKEKPEDIFKRDKDGNLVYRFQACNKALKLLGTLVEFARKMHRDEHTNAFTILPFNPVKAMFETNPRHKSNEPIERCIPLEKVPSVYHMLKERGGTAHSDLHRTAADFARFLTLLAPRRTQGSELRFSHVDFENDRIAMPGDTSKNYRSFVRPLNAPLRELLFHRLALHRQKYEALGQTPPEDDWVFPSSRSACGHIVNCRGTLKRTWAVSGEHWAPHDARRSLTYVANECGATDDMRRGLLDHTIGVHGRYFAKPEKLSKLLTKMGEFMETMNDEAGSSVAPSSPPPALPPDDALHRRRAWKSITAAQLVELVWQKPTVQVGKMFGISDKAVEKRCKLWGIRKPVRGYWAKVESGKIEKMTAPSLAAPQNVPAPAAPKQASNGAPAAETAAKPDAPPATLPETPWAAGTDASLDTSVAPSVP